MGPAEYALAMIASSDRPFVIVAGAASRDVTAVDPRGWRLGGPVTYASLTLARLGLRVGAVVGVDAEAAAAHELKALETAGAIVIRVPLASGPIFEIMETANGRALRCLATSDPMGVLSVPRAWLRQGTPAFLGPVAGELGAEWAGVGGDQLALGWQGLLREMHPGEEVKRTAPVSHPLIDIATIVGLSREDLALETRPVDLAPMLASGATLVCTDGERGGDVLAITGDGRVAEAWHYIAVPSDRVVDATGAGDVFLAAMFAARVDPSLGPEVLVGAAAASISVEGFGIEAVPSRAAVLERMRRAVSRANRWASDDSSRASGRPSQA